MPRPELAGAGAGAAANRVRSARAGRRRRARRSIATRWLGPIASIDRDSAYLTPAILDGRWMVRVSIGAEQTERSHVAALWESIRQAVRSGG